jgi:hypothetical protein
LLAATSVTGASITGDRDVDFSTCFGRTGSGSGSGSGSGLGLVGGVLGDSVKPSLELG